MKKVMSLALTGLLAATVAHAASNEVYSVNVVGFQKVELRPGQQIMSACNFEAGVSNTLLEIFGTNTLRQNNSYGLCDRVLLYDPDTQTYQTWAQWTDGVFYKANTGPEWEASISGNPAIPLGAGFFLRSGSSTATNMITYVGDVVMDESMGVPVKVGFQILSYPFSSDIALQDTSFFASGAAANNSYGLCDRVHIYENGTYQAYAVWTDGKWYKANNGPEWEQSILATNTLRAGQGFFYQGRGVITWTETNKYLQSLSN